VLGHPLRLVPKKLEDPTSTNYLEVTTGTSCQLEALHGISHPLEVLNFISRNMEDLSCTNMEGLPMALSDDLALAMPSNFFT
jgi:hypothetical protein